MSWANRWMDMAVLVATWSKDRSKKVGVVIVDHRNVLLSMGWNGFPRGIDDNKEERHERPIKYEWTEHAERNAIYNAASTGVSLSDTTIYITAFPCPDCARAIIQSGITQIVSIKPDFTHERWGEKWMIATEMLLESNVHVEYYDGALIDV